MACDVCKPGGKRRTGLRLQLELFQRTMDLGREDLESFGGGGAVMLWILTMHSN